MDFMTSECLDIVYLSSVVTKSIYAKKGISLVNLVHNCFGNQSTNTECVTNTMSANNLINLNGTRTIRNDKKSIQVPLDGYTLDLTFDIQNDSNVCVSLTLNTCIDTSVTGSCPLIELDYNSFVIQSNNTTIMHQATGKVFTSGEYSLTENDTVLVCSFFNQKAEPLTTVIFLYSDTLLVVNMIGVILSLIGLFFTFTIRCAVKELRTHSGRIVMNLSFALFIAQLFTLLLGYFRGNATACSAAAAFLHYIWLVAFLWMNSMAIDLFRILNSIQLTVRDTDQNRLMYRRYFLYSWCIPAGFVSILSAIQSSDFPRFYFKYGDESVCWIRDEFASLIVFGLPIALVIIVNFGLFICIIYRIRKVKQSTAEIQTNISTGNKISTELKIYIRISTIMGLTWTFGFLASFVDHIAIWYIFIILNTLQGLCITIAFNANHNMLTILRNRKGLHQSSTEEHKLKSRSRSNESKPTKVTDTNNL
ncbi:latrophilin receptor-like protein A [Antedon mediterranea]|uniref:latrophilin receptor-like protein A n=1 Tax=Antedon mediterranea TaxID=105859 RepID=UPI003AF5143C